LNPYEDISTVTQYVRTILPSVDDLRVERVTEGVSTIVYRVRSLAQTSYLRICPDAGVSLAAEVAAHRQLLALGLHIPRVLHFEPLSPIVQRSLMLVTAIAGRSIGYTGPPAAACAIVRQAGYELARLHQVRVQGYGWANRLVQPAGTLAAEYPSLPLWLQAHFAAPLRALADCDGLSRQDADLAAELLDRACRVFRDEEAVLAHGDFDVTHIYFQHDTYTGMIDFGEIRGAHWLYDLAHFAIENRDLLACLLDGYQEIRPLAAADMDHLALTSLLIAARRIGRRMLQRREAHGPDVAYVAASLAAISGRRA
jgi:Ser/Thr protein kinase RdoA (MazF antagonist)